MEKNKDSDIMKVMREIREELSVKYWNNPEILMKDMEEIHKKYKQYDWSSVPKNQLQAITASPESYVVTNL